MSVPRSSSATSAAAASAAAGFAARRPPAGFEHRQLVDADDLAQRRQRSGTEASFPVAPRPRRTRARPRSARGCTRTPSPSSSGRGHDDRPDGHRGPVEQHPFEPRPREHGHGVAASHPAGEQAVGEDVHPLGGLLPGHGPPAVPGFLEVRRGAEAVPEHVLPEGGRGSPREGGLGGRSGERRHGPIVHMEGKPGGRANLWVPVNWRGPHAHDLERLNQLRPRQHPDRAGARHPADGRGLPHPPPRVRDSDQAEALVPAPRARGRGGRAREGLGGEKGEFVLVQESDLESVALQRSQSIEILRFVKLEDVDPVFFDRTYYLAPATAEAARRPYVLLLRAMQESGTAAVGKFVLWGKENLCLIRPQGDTLAMRRSSSPTTSARRRRSRRRSRRPR